MAPFFGPFICVCVCACVCLCVCVWILEGFRDGPPTRKLKPTWSWAPFLGVFQDFKGTPSLSFQRVFRGLAEVPIPSCDTWVPF